MSSDQSSALVQQIASAAHSILSGDASSVQSYANQLEHCRQMRQNLAQLDAGIEQQMRGYLEAVLNLRSGQYVHEELAGLASQMETFAELAHDMRHHLEMRHVSYINEQARHVTGALNEAAGH